MDVVGVDQDPLRLVVQQDLGVGPKGGDHQALRSHDSPDRALLPAEDLDLAQHPAIGVEGLVGQPVDPPLELVEDADEAATDDLGQLAEQLAGGVAQIGVLLDRRPEPVQPEHRLGVHGDQEPGPDEAVDLVGVESVADRGQGVEHDEEVVVVDLVLGELLDVEHVLDGGRIEGEPMAQVLDLLGLPSPDVEPDQATTFDVALDVVGVTGPEPVGPGRTGQRPVRHQSTTGSGSNSRRPWSRRGSTYRANRSHSAAWG